MAAVLVNGKGNVIATGLNSYKTHPLQQRFSKNPEAIHLHAEIDAIRRALRVVDTDELEDCTLYVARVLKSGKPALAKPCPGCQMALYHFNIKDVVWTE